MNKGLVIGGPTANRDDVLSDFTIEEELSPETLKVYLQRYPEYTQDLLALFNELSMNDLEFAEARICDDEV